MHCRSCFAPPHTRPHPSSLRPPLLCGAFHRRLMVLLVVSPLSSRNSGAVGGSCAVAKHAGEAAPECDQDRNHAPLVSADSSGSLQSLSPTWFTALTLMSTYSDAAWRKRIVYVFTTGTALHHRVVFDWNTCSGVRMTFLPTRFCGTRPHACEFVDGDGATTVDAAVRLPCDKRKP